MQVSGIFLDVEMNEESFVFASLRLPISRSSFFISFWVQFSKPCLI